MKLYAITDMFYSLQGEGVHAGVPAVFIRFAGSPGSDGFYDQREFPFRDRLTANEVAKLARICAFRCEWAILAGAEPALQLDADLVDALHEVDFNIAIETGGMISLDKFSLDWIAVLPDPGSELHVNYADEIRYFIRDGDPIPIPPVRARNYVLLPATGRDQADAGNLEWCIRLVKKHPQWRLSIPWRKI